MSLLIENRTLKWDDYPKMDESPDGWDAHTFPHCDWQGTAVPANGKYHYKDLNVSLRLDREQSWVVKGKTTALLLKHEQAHYNIAIIAARALYARILGLSCESPTALQGAGDAAFEEIFKADDAADNKSLQERITDMYDEDISCGTDHGRNSQNQTLWTLQINNVLQNPAGKLSALNTCPPTQKRAIKPVRHAAAKK